MYLLIHCLFNLGEGGLGMCRSPLRYTAQAVLMVPSPLWWPWDVPLSTALPLQTRLHLVLPTGVVSLRVASCFSLFLAAGQLLSSSPVYHALPPLYHQPFSKQPAQKNETHPEAYMDLVIIARHRV
jgi:hypothetical protein